jgi:hypothetical protein
MEQDMTKKKDKDAQRKWIALTEAFAANSTAISALR